MKSRETPTRIGQFARIEEDKRPGFHTKFLVDRQGCPACGNITRYELKPPTMPAVSTCPHCTGPEEKKFSSGEPTWMFNYTYIPQFEEKVQNKQKPKRPFYPVKKGARGSTMVNFRPGSSIYSIFLERVKDQPDWTLQFYHEKSGGMYEVGNRIRMDHWAVITWAFADLIRKATGNLRTKKLPDPSIYNTYINQHAWPEYALEDRFVLDALESAFKYLTREYRIARQEEAAPRTADLRDLIPRGEVQTDLFSFFPQEATA